MTARPLTPAEVRRVTTCPDCDCPWRAHHGTPGLERGHWVDALTWCHCALGDETLTQVAALRDEWQAAAWDEGVSFAYEAFGVPMQLHAWRNPYRETPS